ncbi:ubiquitin-like protein 7 isoform X1 [Aplysia californica]|uniref:Ubiquitin-like protein 7 isoform X1 n=1 Tax=Aplysia californica TaxID=6500 RepID=A0ABM1A824_APLCA|nr:ubiquitin-like protein 7 isoform X1 [Aplysia californica]
MASVNVCSRLSSNDTKRFQVSVKDLDQIVGILSQEISKYLEVNEENYDIIFAGRVLKPDAVLSKMSIHHLSTVYVVPKFSNVKSGQKDEVVTGPSKSEVTMAMQSALLNLEYRNIVERMLSDPDSVENIIATTPGLDKDPAVLAMLQKPELVAILAHPQNMDSLLQLHPSFAQAAVTIATAVNEEAPKSGISASGGVSYSMDQMSDEDEDMSEVQANRGRRQVPHGASGSQNITASQLAAALQAATGSGSSGTSPPVAVVPSTSQQSMYFLLGIFQPGPSGSGTAISSDFFQQAMAHAQSASSDAALQQLREMGITDENVARQALAATGGDIQAAIDLIFGDGLM